MAKQARKVSLINVGARDEGGLFSRGFGDRYEF